MAEESSFVKKPFIVNRQSLLHSGHVGSYIFQRANIRYGCHAEHEFQEHLENIYESFTNPILESLNSVNGFTRNAYLNRIAAVVPYINVHGVNLKQEIDIAVAMIGCVTEIEEDDMPRIVTTSTCSKYEGLQFLREVAASDLYIDTLENWVQDNPKRISEMIIQNLNFDQTAISIEACITVAFLARRLHFNILVDMDLIIAAMVRMLAIAVVPFERYVSSYHYAIEKHADLEMVRNRSLPFHFCKFRPDFGEIHHRVVGVIYYTIGDILFNVPCPKLIYFFECRIFRRREVARTFMFNILHSITVNIPELRFEAERLSKLPRVKNHELFQTSSKQTLPVIFDKTVWNELPANMYIDLMRVCNDQNAAINMLIKSMLSLLKAHAPVKLAIFEENALATLELYVKHNKIHEKIPNGSTKNSNTLQSISKKLSSSKLSESLPSDNIFSLGLPNLNQFKFALEDDSNEEEEDENYVVDDYEDSFDSKHMSPVFNDEINRASILLDKLPKFLTMASSDLH